MLLSFFKFFLCQPLLDYFINSGLSRNCWYLFS